MQEISEVASNVIKAVVIVIFLVLGRINIALCSCCNID
jgi:hypothetical protein